MDPGGHPLQDPLPASQVGGASHMCLCWLLVCANASSLSPGRDLQQEALRQSHPSWLRSSFAHHQHLLSLCILVVLLAILLHVLRLRRIHRWEQRQAEALRLLWVEEEGGAFLP